MGDDSSKRSARSSSRSIRPSKPNSTSNDTADEHAQESPPSPSTHPRTHRRNLAQRNQRYHRPSTIPPRLRPLIPLGTNHLEQTVDHGQWVIDDSPGHVATARMVSEVGRARVRLATTPFRIAVARLCEVRNVAASTSSPRPQAGERPSDRRRSSPLPGRCQRRRSDHRRVVGSPRQAARRLGGPVLWMVPSGKLIGEFSVGAQLHVPAVRRGSWCGGGRRTAASSPGRCDRRGATR